MLKKLCKLLQQAKYGRIICTAPDGQERLFVGKQPGPSAQLTIHNWSALRAALIAGDVGIARSYQSQQWDSTDLPQLLNWALVNENSLYKLVHGSLIGNLLARLSYLFKVNTRKGSRRNIGAHYDIGNDFYQQMLDSSMSYSSALYQGADLELKDAQQRKYQRALSQLSTNSGKLLEIGCGWGAFARYAHNHGDYLIKGITLSQQQYAYSSELLRSANNIKIALEDYRQQQGCYQSIVSIEMLEAIGKRQWPRYFGLISELLQRSGRAIIQTITIKDDLFQRYRTSADAIRSCVFPGGMLPNPASLRRNIDEANLKLLDYYSFGADYVRTLRCWLNNLNSHEAKIQRLGYPISLIRLWRFYLSYCMAGFAMGRVDVTQLTLER